MTYVFGEQWRSVGGENDPRRNESTMYAKEFRYDYSSPRERYLARDLDPNQVALGQYMLMPGTDVWTDYDPLSSAAYSDWTYENDTVQYGRQYEPRMWTSELGASGLYPHTDLLGTTRVWTDASGEVAPPPPWDPYEDNIYTAFGERICPPTGLCSNLGAGGGYSFIGAFGYRGHDDFPFLHVGARYYDPASGRFLQRDPIGIDGGLNVYEYVFSSPTALIDPSGNGVIGDAIDSGFNWGWRKLPDGFHRIVGGGGHIPVLDPGAAQDWTVGTATVVSFVAPIGAGYKTVTATASTVRSLKGGWIGGKIQRIRQWIRKDPAHHGKPPEWDGTIPKWWRNRQNPPSGGSYGPGG